MSKTRVGILQNAEVVHESPIEESIDINVSQSEIQVHVSINKTETKICESVDLQKKTLTLKDIDVGDVPFTPEQHSSFETFIQNYSDVFCLSENDMGYTDIVKHEIHTVDSKPVAVPHRRNCS